VSTIALAALEACFEGVIPSIVATCAADGTPNVSYLSHVVQVDAGHVALSNQFFSKTARNVRENPQAALLIVDARDGAQYRLDLRFVESRDSGPVFDDVAAQLRASSAQVGLADVMKLRAIDVYRVTDVRRLPHPGAHDTPLDADTSDHLALATALARRIAEAAEIEPLIDTALDGLASEFGYERVLLLLHDAARSCLVAVGSRGYGCSGVGAELPLGEGLAGLAAREKRLLKNNDLSRVRRFAAAIRDSTGADPRREIPLPSLDDALSQIAVPLVAGGRVHGVLFSESRARYAYARRDEAALTLIAGQLAAAIQLVEHGAVDTPAAGAHSAPAMQGPPCRITHHAGDDSVFIDNEYAIKGVPGRLLLFLAEHMLREGRSEFTNRELRLAPELGLPDIKDNLETRLLLLRRRLAEKRMPVQVERVGRGRVALRVSGSLLVERLP
jgi:adenylate cyclase